MSKRETGRLIRVEPSGRVTNIDRPDKILMTDARYQQIRTVLSQIIASGDYKVDAPARLPSGALDEIRKAISNSEVPTLGSSRHSHSSAMFPMASPYWVIGMFGSVWLDTTAGGVLYRVAFDGKGFHVMG